MGSTCCTGSTIRHGRNVFKSEYIVEAASPGVAGQCAARVAQQGWGIFKESYNMCFGNLASRNNPDVISFSSGYEFPMHSGDHQPSPNIKGIKLFARVCEK